MDLVVTCHGRSWGGGSWGGGSWEAPIEGGLRLTAGSWRIAGDSERASKSRSSLCRAPVWIHCKGRGWPPRVVQCRLQKGEGESGWGGATRFLDGLGLAGRRQLAEGGRLRSQVQGGVSARITGPERE